MMTNLYKKQKVQESEPTFTRKWSAQAWDHYRRFLDSCEDEEGNEIPGDFDELHAIVELLEDQPGTLDGSKDPFHESPPADIRLDSFLPILLSVVHYHLADEAISEDLSSSEASPSTRETAIEHLTKSLCYCHSNAGSWSMGANFGRMTRILDTPLVLAWYEKAVESVKQLRTTTFDLLENSEVCNDVKEVIELLYLHQILGIEFIEDEQEEDLGEEHDEDDEVPGHYSYSAVEATARFMCAMLCSTIHKHDLALDHLRRFPLSHRLHPRVWMENGTIQSNGKAPSKVPSMAPVAFRPQEGILPQDIYDRLCSIFAPDAPFWEESDYSNRGYYSFFTEYLEKDESKRPSNLIEHVIVKYLLPRAQQVLDANNMKDKICGFEWWAHTRPIQANLGHNLHFDTDESRLAKEGDVTHPILSSVLYLTGGNHVGNSKDVHGGATIVLDQTPHTKQNATRCWKSHPLNNSFMLFPGNLLHGVLPCPGEESQIDVNPAERGELYEALNQEYKSRSLSGSKQKANDCESDSNSHRLTFMVGFWTRNVPEGMEDRHLYGPCGPLPPETADHSWVQEIVRQSKEMQDEKAPPDAGTSEYYLLPEIPVAWEEIGTKSIIKQPAVSALEIPSGIDHRFFVGGAPECFYESLMEDIRLKGKPDDE